MRDDFTKSKNYFAKSARGAARVVLSSLRRERLRLEKISHGRVVHAHAMFHQRTPSLHARSIARTGVIPRPTKHVMTRREERSPKRTL